MTMMQILFGFEGRIRRTTWWLAHLGLVGALIAVSAVFGVIFGIIGAVVGHGANPDAGGPGGVLAIVFGLIFLLVFLAVFVGLVWSSLALGVKRCHDRDYPGVMILIAFVPFFGSLWQLIDLGFIDGTQGPNRFGPSPKGLAGPALGQVFA